MKKHVILTLLLVFHLLPAQAVEIPPDFVAHYKLEKYSALIGEIDLRLSTENDKLNYSSHTKPRGIAALFRDDRISETSRLQVLSRNQLPRLLHYEYQHKGKENRNQHFDIDYTDDINASINGNFSENIFSISSKPPVWDRLSVQLALSCELNSTPQQQKSYLYQVLDRGELHEYKFEHKGDDRLKISDQQYHVVKFVRHHGKRDTVFWLAQELHYLPVKMEQYKDGDLHLTMRLDSINYD